MTIYHGMNMFRKYADSQSSHFTRRLAIRLSTILFDAYINKMQKKKLSRLIMICSCVTMLCINAFAWNFSSISLMIIAAIISLLVFVLRGTQEQKGGAKK